MNIGQPEESTQLSYTGQVGELEHLKKFCLFICSWIKKGEIRGKKSCVSLIDKVRGKDKTYIWVSVRWETKTWRNIYLYIYYESTKRKVKTKYICECRCYESLQSKTKEFTRLSYTKESTQKMSRYLCSSDDFALLLLIFVFPFGSCLFFHYLLLA